MGNVGMAGVGTTMAQGVWAWGTWAPLWHGGCEHHYGTGDMGTTMATMGTTTWDMGMGGVGTTMDPGVSRGSVGGLWMWAEDTGPWGDVTGTVMCGAGR